MKAWQTLRSGDEIRVIAPSSSRSHRMSQTGLERATRRMANLGYKVTFGSSLDKQSYLGTASADDRLEDLRAAYTDRSVKAIIALTGGWSANDLLPRIDWQIIRDNPKPFIGFSDITVLLNAIYAQTGQVALLGPNFHTLGKMTSWDYTCTNLNAVLRQRLPLKLKKSTEWSDKPNERRKTKPWIILQSGKAEARVIGGNLGTFYLLQGTPYQPQLDRPFILAAEDDDESGALTGREFSRRLESILQLPDARNNLKGVIIGRFQPGSKFKDKELLDVIAAKQLANIPVVSGVDFGHTVPTMTLPIGGIVELIAADNSVALTIKSITSDTLQPGKDGE